MSNLSNRQHLFFISKSENKNQVHYAINLDNNCHPIGTTPVYAYWLMLEKGPSFTESLLNRELPAYGISNQTINNNTVSFTLNALPKRLITISNSLENGKCISKATTHINNDISIVQFVYVDLWLFGVKKITIHGIKISDSSKVEEVVK